MTPYELIAEYIAPYLRGLVILKLTEMGYSQPKISRMIGISQPMVSKYIKLGRDALLTHLLKLGLFQEEIEAIINMLAKTLERERYREYLRIFSTYCGYILRKGYLCEIHRKTYPLLSKDCDICIKLIPTLIDPYIEEVMYIYNALKELSKAYKLVPEVGMNIVCSVPEADDIGGVVGFSGRIIAIRNTLEAVGEPVYGGSRHTASILLLVKKMWRDIRCGIVIRYIDDCSTLYKREFISIETGPHKDPKELLIDIAETLRGFKNRIDAIIDKGGIALEPVIYLFAENGDKLVNKVKKCIEII